MSRCGIGSAVGQCVSWSILLLGCGRSGGDGPAPVPQAAPSAVATPSVGAAVAEVPALEARLGIQLPTRRGSRVLPTARALPWRILRGFDPDKALVTRLDANGLHTLGIDLAATSTDDELSRHFRDGAEAWRRRAGVAATRLVLALDDGIAPDVAGRAGRLAAAAAPWRVVALARDGDQLVEVVLNPMARAPAADLPLAATPP